jgi:hypothetical protein
MAAVGAEKFMSVILTYLGSNVTSLLFVAKYYNASPGAGPIYGLIFERRGQAAENCFGRNDRRAAFGQHTGLRAFRQS